MSKTSTFDLVMKVENNPPHKHTYKWKSSKSQCRSLCGGKKDRDGVGVW